MDGWLDVVGFQVDAGQEDTGWRAQGNTVTTLPPPGRAISRILIPIRSALSSTQQEEPRTLQDKDQNSYPLAASVGAA